MNRPVYDPSSTRDCRACGHGERHNYGGDLCLTCQKNYPVVPRPRCTEEQRYIADMEAYATWLEQQHEADQKRISELEQMNAAWQRVDVAANDKKNELFVQIHELKRQLAERDGMVRLTTKDVARAYVDHQAECRNKEGTCAYGNRLRAAIIAAQPADLQEKG